MTDLHPIFLEKLVEMEMSYHYDPNISKVAAQEILKDYHGLIVRTQFPIDQDFLEYGKKLEFIGRAGAGMDNIDIEYAASKNILCINAPEGNSNAVAEHSLALLLSISNKITKAYDEVRNGTWDREGNRGFEIQGKTLGIIGMGHMGTALSRKMAGFETNIIGYDKYKSGFSNGKVKEVSMENFFEEADIVSLHIPLTPETRHMVNKEFLGRFRKPIILINTARGEIIQTQDLIEGLKNGRLIGVGLDVLENEKFPETNSQNWFRELIQYKQVVISPHVAGWTKESYYKISIVLADKIRKIYF